MASVVRNFLAINDPDPKEMTIVEHLEELRRRLIICIAVVTVGSGVGWFFKESAFNFLTVPLKPFTGGLLMVTTATPSRRWYSTK